MEEQYDVEWSEPLPHSLAQPKYYLSPISENTKALVIFMHGRGENIDDMVGVFLPTFAKRYGGVDDVRLAIETANSSVSLMGLEARDNVWYPQGPVLTAADDKINGPYTFSALELLRTTLRDVVFAAKDPLPASRIIVVGFSQGAILTNAYLVAALEQQNDNANAPTLPVPAHIFSLAGSLFGVKPVFPERSGFGSKEEYHSYQARAEEEVKFAHSLAHDHPVTIHLLCGDCDRYFPENEIVETGRSFVRLRDDARQRGSNVAKFLDIGVGIEKGAPHTITQRMIAAVLVAVDELVAK